MRVVVQVLGSLVVLAAAGALAGWLIASREQVEPEPLVVVAPSVEVLTVERAPARRRVRARGEVVAPQETTLAAEVAGRVVTLAPSLEVGGAFAQGDVLVALDRADYELALARARAAVEEARTALVREEAEAGVARAEFEALGRGEPSALALREPQLAEARARLAAAEAELARAELDLERTRVRAPYTGRVRARSVGLGQFVARGEALAEVFATDRAEVRLAVPDRELAHLELPLHGVLGGVLAGGAGVEDGPEVTLRATFAGAPRRWRGRIVRVGAEVDRTSRMITLVAEVPEPYAGAADGEERAPLLVGLFVEAEIEGRLDEAVARLPRKALVDEASVWVVDADERLRRRAVEVAWYDGEQVTVSAGLAAGERVCVSPLAVPVEGMTVRVLGAGGERRPAAEAPR